MLDQMIGRWKANPQDKQATSQILKALQPTIKSALTTFAQGQQKSLRIQAARLALQSLKTYDPSKNVAPSTYAFHNLKRLNRLRAERDQVVRQPQNVRYAKSIIQTRSNEFLQDYGRQPSLQELSDATGINQKKLARIQNANTIISDSMGTDSQTENMTAGSQKDVTPDDYLDYVYHSVSPLDQKIIQYSSGYRGQPIIGTNQIAKKLNISNAAISQHKSKIQKMLTDIRGLV